MARTGTQRGGRMAENKMAIMQARLQGSRLGQYMILRAEILSLTIPSSRQGGTADCMQVFIGIRS
jgi:hypothetical protein